MSTAAALPNARHTTRNLCALRFAVRDGVTRLVEATAGGPIRVVRANPGHICDAMLVQARGGLCNGDRWRIEVDVGAGARVRLRAAAATLLQSGRCGLRTHLRVEAGAVLTWRSPGVIARPDAWGVVVLVVDAAAGALVGCDELLHCDSGAVLRARTVVNRRSRPLHEEWTSLGGAGDHVATRLDHHTHAGSAVIVGARTLRGAGQAGGLLAAQGRVRPGLHVARALGTSLQSLDAHLGALVESLHAGPPATTAPRGAGRPGRGG